MGMFAEIHAESTAKKLEAIILRTMKDGKYNNIRSAACAVSHYELVEWYYDECGETFGSHNPHPEILERFPSEENQDLSNDSSPMNTFGRDNYGE